MTERQADKAIGARLRDLREALSLSQPEVQRRAGVSVNTLSVIENGKRTPDTDTLARLAGCYGVSLASLLGDGADVEATIARERERATIRDAVAQLRSLAARLESALGGEASGPVAPAVSAAARGASLGAPPAPTTKLGGRRKPSTRK